MNGISPDSSLDRFSFSESFHPDHIGESHSCVFFLCTCCGEAQEVSDQSLDSRLAEMASELGFSAEQPVIEVAGLCRKCHHEHGAAQRLAK